MGIPIPKIGGIKPKSSSVEPSLSGGHSGREAAALFWHRDATPT